jgi:hypothetical protein
MIVLFSYFCSLFNQKRKTRQQPQNFSRAGFSGVAYCLFADHLLPLKAQLLFLF